MCADEGTPPMPVLTGLTFSSQGIEAVFGITKGRFYDHFTVVPEILACAAVTIASIYAAKRFLPKLPASLVGLLVGTSAYLLIGKLSAPDLLKFEGNPYIVGKIPTGLPMPTNIAAFAA